VGPREQAASPIVLAAAPNPPSQNHWRPNLV
jgi:hypothetical protein